MTTDNPIPFPGTTGPPSPATGGELEPVPEVLDGELVGELDYTRWAMPVVLPPWLRSRDTALATLRWAVQYAGRQWPSTLCVPPATGWRWPGGPCAVRVGQLPLGWAG